SQPSATGAPASNRPALPPQSPPECASISFRSNVWVRAYSTPREEGWLRSKKMMRSHRSGADGVVAHTERFEFAFRNILRERPPRPLHQRRLRGIFLDVASSPPHEEGNSFAHR